MAPKVIYVQYDGEEEENKGQYEWFAKNREVISMFIKDSNIKFEEYVKKLYERVGIDQNGQELKQSYLLILARRK